MFKDLTGQAIKNLQLQSLTEKICCKIFLETYKHSAWDFILKNHKYNILLWQEEDLARRIDVSDSDIATNKRNIDKYNQKRNDYIEKIDEAIIASIPVSHDFKENLWVNSETAGSIIDRMSINVLRVFNMKKQINREDISSVVKTECEAKLNILDHQGAHLTTCLDNLLMGMKKGEAIFRTYKQFKMYNDRELNPYLAKFYKKHV